MPPCVPGGGLSTRSNSVLLSGFRSSSPLIRSDSAFEIPGPDFELGRTPEFGDRLGSGVVVGLVCPETKSGKDAVSTAKAARDGGTRRASGSGRAGAHTLTPNSSHRVKGCNPLPAGPGPRTSPGGGSGGACGL